MDKPNSTSIDYDAQIGFWNMVTDITEGTHAIRAGAESYLPRFPNETRKDYESRLQQAKFTNIYSDILEGLASKPFARELMVDDSASERFKQYAEDVDGRGNHLHVFAGDVFFSGINKAISWILIDYTNPDGELRTVADERAAGVRPYWVHIEPESLIDVQSQIIAGREQIIHARILESKDRVRQFDREGDSVTWTLHEKNSEGIWTITDEGLISIGVIPLVPFITGRRKGKSWQFHPPMKDAADLQIELYQQESGLKHIKNLTCFPMLAANGVEPTRNGDSIEPVPVGPQAVLYAPPGSDGRHGEWRWITTDPGALEFLKSDIQETKRDLRELGRQPLTAQSGNLTVITTAFAAQKGNSAVQAWALRFKDALENAFRITALWLNEVEEVTVSVFTDFGVDEIEGESVRALLDMRQPNDIGEVDISRRTLWEELKRRGTLSAEFDPDTELENIVDEIGGLPDADADGATLDEAI